MADGWNGHPVRDDIPEELLSAVLKMWGFDRKLFDKGYYEREYYLHRFYQDLYSVTESKNISEKGQKECWMWSINEKGRKLIKWLNE